MVAAIKNKCTSDELLEQLKEVESDTLRVEVFTQSLLFLGHKSFSHSFAAIAKFHPIFKALADTEENQICVLKSVFELWRSHQQMLVVLCDKLLKTGVVECAAVANWVFSKDMVPEFSKCYIWEIVHITIRKMNKHVSKLSKEASEARRLIEDSESDSSDSDDEAGGGKQRRRERRPLERPTEETVEKLEERLEAAQADQKNLFLIIFQRFIMILSEHLVRCDTDAVDFKNPWYLWTVGRLHQIFMLHHEQVERYSSTLETLLFTQDLDPNILDVFHQFVALRM
jgi:nuclear cap-binding protein subunit 1